MNNIHAYTAVGSFPAFISINEDSGLYRVSVRNHGDGTCGETGHIEMNKDQLIEMAKDILSEFSEKGFDRQNNEGDLVDNS